MIGETEFQVTARFQNSETVLKVTAYTPYGDRKVAVSQDVTDAEMLESLAAICERAIQESKQDLISKSFQAAAQAIVVAGQRGENL